jgi:hypothetical protein
MNSGPKLEKCSSEDDEGSSVPDERLSWWRRESMYSASIGQKPEGITKSGSGRVYDER